MAITRRQFVTRLGALAAATGLSQTHLLKITEALGHDGTTVWTDKPKVVWVHGAECTGCSTSLLGLFEDVRGLSVEDKSLTASLADPAAGLSTLAALDLAVGGDGDGGAVLGATAKSVLGITEDEQTGHDTFAHRTLWEATMALGLPLDADGSANLTPVDPTGVMPTGIATPYVANIADVLIDFISLEYHETVMSMGGDLAFRELEDWRSGVNGSNFVLVIEGAIQVHEQGGAWDETAAAVTSVSDIDVTTEAAWCSVGMNAAGTEEHRFDATVAELATHAAAIIAIGQCACFGGYPGCVSPAAEFEGESQTPAYGAFEFLSSPTLCHLTAPQCAAAAAKVINVPGCPTNPWWFVLTVVLFLASTVNDVPAILAKDDQQRLKAVYGTSIHGPACPRYKYSFPNWDGAGSAARYAQFPGDIGCLAVLGCKGTSTNSLCSVHGWNGQQPHNDETWDQGVGAIQGEFMSTTGRNYAGFCVTGGHPCMGCTETGYPDAYVPFIAQR